jgi:hypothetical protein
MPQEIKRRGEEQDAGARIEAATEKAKRAAEHAAGA